MRHKKSSFDYCNDASYPNFLQKLCKDGDVYIIPQFIAYYADRYSECISPRISKDLNRQSIDKNVGSSAFINDSTQEDSFTCGSLRPPLVEIIYETFEDRDCPVTVMCKSMYIEFSLVEAIGRSLQPYPTITSLKIENCCISKEVAEALVCILSDEPGKRISDLSLDGNPHIIQTLPFFVSYSTGLRYLSLRKCGLDDEAVKIFSKSLAFFGERDQSLRVLNLSLNKIGNMGVFYLAEALRTNRTLTSLVLAGNQIGDEGISYLTEVLQEFSLTHEEVKLRRKKIFNQILKKKSAIDKLLEEWKTRGEVDSQTSKISSQSADRFASSGKKIRGIDGKLRCLSSRDKKGKSVPYKITPGEKFRSKIRNTLEDNQNNFYPTPSELLAIQQQVESEMSPDPHPFITEVLKRGGELLCRGCWSLGSLNLAYNCFSEKSVEKFLKVFQYQSKVFKPSKLGLLRVLLLAGFFSNRKSEQLTIWRAKCIQGSCKSPNPERDACQQTSVNDVMTNEIVYSVALKIRSSSVGEETCRKPLVKGKEKSHGNWDGEVCNFNLLRQRHNLRKILTKSRKYKKTDFVNKDVAIQKREIVNSQRYTGTDKSKVNFMDDMEMHQAKEKRVFSNICVRLVKKAITFIFVI